MKRCGLIIVVLLLYPTLVFAPSYDERMSVQELYYKLLEESRLVREDEERAEREKTIEERDKLYRHHKIQRIGPDPAPEDDPTIDQPDEEDVLEQPYSKSDVLEAPSIENSPLDDPE